MINDPYVDKSMVRINGKPLFIVWENDVWMARIYWDKNIKKWVLDYE